MPNRVEVQIKVNIENDHAIYLSEYDIKFGVSIIRPRHVRLAEGIHRHIKEIQKLVGTYYNTVPELMSKPPEEEKE